MHLYNLDPTKPHLAAPENGVSLPEDVRGIVPHTEKAYLYLRFRVF